MKKVRTILGSISFISITLSSFVTNSSANEKLEITKRNNAYIAFNKNVMQVSVSNNRSEENPAKEANLNFEQLYPILKKSLLEEICEESHPYRTEEESNRLLVYSLESDSFLSSWEWNLLENPLRVKDIDNDGLMDYTVELVNEGGGCGGQMGESERWTLFGSTPEKFIWTHVIPYRSVSGRWEKL
jgi:hypothetical protein